MSLKEQLDALKAKSQERIPKEAQAILHRSVQDLRDSGIVARALKVGDRMPDFTLANIEGRSVSSKDLLGRGPVVLTFYRGKW